MMASWRRVALAAAFVTFVSAGAATAQTLIVNHVPSNSAVEVLLNATTIATSKADAEGRASIVLDSTKLGGRTQLDVRFYVDACSASRRVLLVEPGLQPPFIGEGCTRKDIYGVFILRKMTSVLVDMAGTTPTVWLRQGPMPPTWLTQDPEQLRLAKSTIPVPKGLVLFAGGGATLFGTITAPHCGEVAACFTSETRPTYTAGATFWVTKFLGVEFNYLKPSDATIEGEDALFHYETSVETRTVNLLLVGGLPLGRVRFYGKGGASYHRSSTLTIETIEDQFASDDGSGTMIPGGTQHFLSKTAGWSWMAGGGFEVWATANSAVFVEAGRVVMKGKSVGPGEGVFDERATFFVGGLRYRFGRQ